MRNLLFLNYAFDISHFRVEQHRLVMTNFLLVSCYFLNQISSYFTTQRSCSSLVMQSNVSGRFPLIPIMVVHIVISSQVIQENFISIERGKNSGIDILYCHQCTPLLLVIDDLYLVKICSTVVYEHLNPKSSCQQAFVGLFTHFEQNC